MPPTDTPERTPGKRRVWKWTILSIAGPAVLSMSVVTLWLYSWRWSPTPDFHTGWNADQQAELRRMDDWLTGTKGRNWAMQDTSHGSKTLQKLILETHWRKGWAAEMARSLLQDAAQRLACAPIRDMLHECIRSGRGDVYTERGMSPALLALEHFGSIELAKEMIRRGGDPNKGYRIDIRFADLTTQMTPTLACIALRRPVEQALPPGADRAALLKQAHLYPATERIALLEWMLAQGGKLNADEECCAQEAQFSDFFSTDGCTVSAWLLRHGFEPSDRNRRLIASSLLLWAPLPLLQELQQEGHIDLRKPELDEEQLPYRTPLQLLCSCYDFDLQQVEKAAWLLEMGADPNAVAHTGDIFSAPHIHSHHSPLYLAIHSAAHTERKEFAGTAMIELLLRHGARLHEGEEVELDRTNHKMTDLLDKYRIPWVQM